MILITGSITILSRLMGGVAASTLGWATILLFGRVPQSRQRLLSLMALGAVGWLICVVALISPPIDRLLVAAVPRPGFVDRTWIGWLVILGVVALPAIVGVTSTLLSSARPSLGAAVADVLRGYPLTVVLAGTIVFLAGWAIVRAARTQRRGWQSLHLAMMVKPHGYETVADDLGRALATAGLDVTREEASPWFVVPPKLLALAGGRGVHGLVPDKLVAFECEDLGILIYPSDVALIGKTELVARARAAIVRALAFTAAYLTSTEESERIEDALRQLAERHAFDPGDFMRIDDQLNELDAPDSDWETLYRLRLQVEHEVRTRSAAVFSRQAS